MKNCLLLLFLILLLPPAAAFSAEASVFDSHELRVTEPVFGGEVRILEAGRGKPVSVLLVHGLGDLAGGTWEKLIPELVSDHVIAVDRPASAVQQRPLFPAHAAFLKWVVDRYAPGHWSSSATAGAMPLRLRQTTPKPQQLILADVAGILHRRLHQELLPHCFRSCRPG
jgi:hypothetical protein